MVMVVKPDDCEAVVVQGVVRTEMEEKEPCCSSCTKEISASIDWLLGNCSLNFHRYVPPSNLNNGNPLVLLYQSTCCEAPLSLSLAIS